MSHQQSDGISQIVSEARRTVNDHSKTRVVVLKF